MRRSISHLPTAIGFLRHETDSTPVDPMGRAVVGSAGRHGGPAQDAPATGRRQRGAEGYAEAEEGTAERTLGLQAFQRTAHGIGLSFYSVGQGATHSRLATMRAGKVVGKLFDAFQARGQRDLA
jgi:hypothetical protein